MSAMMIHIVRNATNVVKVLNMSYSELTTPINHLDRGEYIVKWVMKSYEPEDVYQFCQEILGVQYSLCKLQYEA